MTDMAAPSGIAVVRDKLGRLEIASVERLEWAVKVVASFDYRDVRRDVIRGACKILLPVGSGPFPLYYYAGYEVRDEVMRGMVALGCAVVNPVAPARVWALREMPLRRSINLDAALLHIARSLDCIDDSRVVLGGGCAGALTTWLLTAETFPLAASIPDSSEINAGYNAWYIARSQRLQAGIQPPLMPAIAAAYDIVAEPLARHDCRSAVWLQHSPVAHADAITSPVHLVHATSDLLHPVEQIARSLHREPVGMPAGFLTTDESSWLFLEDVFPDLKIVPVSVPDGAPLVAVDQSQVDRWMRGRSEAPSPDGSSRAPKRPPAMVSLPDPRAQMVACIIEDGGPSPSTGHFRYSMAFLRGAFLLRVLAHPCDAAAQFTTGKRRVLESRLRGEDWIRTPLSHLDFPEAERADVERALAHVR
jgi:hypothetical protein